MAFMTDKWNGTEFFKVIDFDHVEFYVGNAKQVVHFYRSAFGFQPLAYIGPETGVRDKVSYVLTQNGINLVFSGSFCLSDPDAAFLGFANRSFNFSKSSFLYKLHLLYLYL